MNMKTEDSVMKKTFKNIRGWVAVAILGDMGAGTILSMIGTFAGAQNLANAGFFAAIAGFGIAGAMVDVFKNDLQSNAEGGDEA